MKKFIFLTVLLLIVPVLTFADTTITQQDDDDLNKFYFKNNKMAIYENDEIQEIIDVKNKKIIIVEGSHYAEATFAEYLNQRELFYKKMLNKIMNNPREKKYFFDNQKELSKEKYTYKKTASKKINNYNCQCYTIFRNNVKYKEIWVSAQIQKEINKDFNSQVLHNFYKQDLAIQKKYALLDGEDAIENEIRQKGFIVLEQDLAEGMVFPGLENFPAAIPDKAISKRKTNINISKEKINSHKLKVNKKMKKISLQHYFQEED